MLMENNYLSFSINDYLVNRLKYIVTYRFVLSMPSNRSKCQFIFISWLRFLAVEYKSTVYVLGIDIMRHSENGSMSVISNAVTFYHLL